MNVMLLAAGEGTRLRPYTLQTPKPAIPLLTAPLAAYSLSLLEDIKVHNLVVNTYHLPEKIEDLFYHLYPACDKIIYTHETPTLLGSGGGIHNARAYLEGRGHFLVMNADEVILPHHFSMLEDFISAHKFNQGLATLMTMTHPEVGKKFGGAWSKTKAEINNEISMFSKTSPGSEYQGHHFIGPMIFSDRIFSYFKDTVEVENILYETLTKAIAANEKVFTHEVQCDWQETGNPQDFLKATSHYAHRLQEAPEHPSSQFLQKTLRKFGGKAPLIENENPRVLAEVQNAIINIA